MFDTKELSFRLYQYEAGEILDSRDGVAKNLRFIVKGGAHIYSVREDGSYYPVGVTKGFTLLGDMEFCGETELPLIVEVIRAMTCVELPLLRRNWFIIWNMTVRKGNLREWGKWPNIFAAAGGSYSGC